MAQQFIGNSQLFQYFQDLNGHVSKLFKISIVFKLDLKLLIIKNNFWFIVVAFKSMSRKVFFE